MKKYLASDNGFMLLELLIGMAITVMLVTVVAGLLTVSVTSSCVGSAKIEAQETARVAIDAIAREIRTKALAITSSTADTISIQVPDTQVSSRINTITFHRANNTLYRRQVKWDGSTQNFPITENTVTALAFEVNPLRTIKIALTVKVANESFSLFTTVVGMNIQ